MALDFNDLKILRKINKISTNRVFIYEKNY